MRNFKKLLKTDFYYGGIKGEAKVIK